MEKMPLQDLDIGDFLSDWWGRTQGGTSPLGAASAPSSRSLPCLSSCPGFFWWWKVLWRKMLWRKIENLLFCHSNKNPKTNGTRNGVLLWLTCPYCCGKDCVRKDFGTLYKKSDWVLVLGGLFSRSLEDKNVEGRAENGVLACEVSEGSLKTLIH